MTRGRWLGLGIGLMILGSMGAQAADRFPWVNEPVKLGDRMKLDVRLVQLDGGNEDSFSVFAASFLDHEVGPETPHVPYARPYYRGPIHILYLTSYPIDPRNVVELQQRLDAKIDRFRIPVVPYLQQLADIALPRFLKMLEGNYDVIIYDSDHVTADERYLKPLLAKVEQGVGLVYLQNSPRQNVANFKILSPLLTLRDQGSNAVKKEPVVSQDHPAVNGIPFDLLQYTQYARNAAQTGATVVASIGSDAVVAVGQYGRGRLVGIGYNDALGFGRPETTGIYYRHWEYVFALQARCALWASGREPETKMNLSLPLTVELGTPVKTEVSVQGDQDLLKGCQLRMAWYDDEHQLMKEQTVRITGTGSIKVTCDKPLRAGQVLVDARLVDSKGRAVDWASGGTLVKAPDDVLLKIDPERFQDGQTVSMTVIGWKSTGARVHFRVTDSFQRLVFDNVNGEGKTAWKAEHVRGSLFRVVADIENKRGDVLLRQRGIVTCPKYGVDDYYTFMWPGPAAPYNLDLVMALYRDCGIDGTYNCPWDSNWWYATVSNHMKNMGGNLANLWSWGNILKNPLLSDEGGAEIKQRGYEDSLKLIRHFGMVWGSLQDEGALGVEGYGFDNFTLTAFRKELQGRYPSIEALNQQWGTTFSAWEQVKPALSEEMKGRTNYGQWLEFRRFMDQRGALQMGEIVAGMKEAAGTPDVPVGVEGIFGFTDHHVPFGLTDYGFMTRAGLSLAPYNAPECFQEGGGISNDSDLDSALNPQKAPAAWCGYSMPEWQQRLYPWWGAFHGYVGCGYFQGACFTDSAGAKYERARWIEESTRPLRHGVGKLLLNSQRHFDPVAIYFDMGNLQLAWIVARTQDKGWMHRLVVDGKAGMERILQDLSITPGYVTPDTITDGALKNYKAVILTGAVRLSKNTLAALQAFAESGGVVVADGLIGIYDDTGRLTGPDYVKNLFGVVRKDLKIKMLPGQYSLGAGLKPSELFPSLPLDWMKGTLFEEGLVVDGGNALGAHVEIADAPGFIEKRVGKGRTLLINAVNTTYSQDADERDLNVWRALMKDCGVKPLARVCNDGMPLNQYDVKTFTGKGIVVAGIIRSPRFGAINPLEVDVTFERDGELYDVIGGKYLGNSKSARMTLFPGKPALLAQVAKKVMGVKVKTNSSVTRGDLVNLEIGLSPVGCHDTVLRLEVFRPDGQLDESLTNNLTVRDGRYMGILPIALNDSKGKWKIRIKEIVSHTVGETTFLVR